MLVVVIALVSLANSALGLLPEIAGDKVTLQRLFGTHLRDEVRYTQEQVTA